MATRYLLLIKCLRLHKLEFIFLHLELGKESISRHYYMNLGELNQAQHFKRH